MLVAQEGGKTGTRRKNFGTMKEPTTNSTQIWNRAGIDAVINNWVFFDKNDEGTAHERNTEANNFTDLI